MGDAENSGGSLSDTGSAAGAAASPSTFLTGGVEVKHKKEPEQGPSCQVPKQPWPQLKAMKALLDPITKKKPHQASANNTRLKTGATKTGPPPGNTNVNLPGPLQAKADQSPPLKTNVQVDVPYNPLKPGMGQLVPINVTKVPPGWIIRQAPENPKLRYLVPDEDVPNDQTPAWIAYIIAVIITDGGAAVVVPKPVPIEPVPIPVPPPQPLEKAVEWVWVYTRKDGTKIIWRKGSNWFGKTNTGDWMTLEDALKVGRFPLDLYNKLTHGGGIGF